MSPQPGLPAEEGRGDHLGEHVIKPGRPPRGVNLPYPGRNGRIMVNKGSHIPIITMRPSSRHTATPTLTKCGWPTRVSMSPPWPGVRTRDAAVERAVIVVPHGRRSRFGVILDADETICWQITRLGLSRLSQVGEI